ncbi:MAG: CBS domain-containing protein [Elusimicrobiota bacterium]|nr:MAG: CBS domain-containing protein [Elusimicrobiota bacterium]
MPVDLLKKHPTILIKPAARLRDAAAAMTKSGLGIALVVGPRRRLLGVVTDIDIRRALLGKGSLEASVSGAMNRRPVTVPVGSSREALSEVFRRTSHAYIPVVDGAGTLKGSPRSSTTSPSRPAIRTGWSSWPAARASACFR